MTSVALHDLAGEAGAPPLLIAHATGFHGRAYLPVAERLAPPFHVHALDFRGHGDTPAPPGWDVDWSGYGDDALSAADELTDAGRASPLTAFGHSMGGAALLLAAHRRPEMFRLLVLYEPIVFPPEAFIGERPNPLSEGARRRRATFPSIDAAIDNYAAKAPLGDFDPAALDAYVRYGFRADGDDHIRLKCAPEHEARTFEQSRTNGVWDLLAEIETPTLVVAGRVDDEAPSRAAEPAAERLPNGRFLEVPELDHFGPFTQPGKVAELVLEASPTL